MLRPELADKHYPQAIQAYSDAIECSPLSALLYANRSVAHLRLEEYGSAVADASKAIELDPKYVKVKPAEDSARTLLPGLAAIGNHGLSFGCTLPAQAGCCSCLRLACCEAQYATLPLPLCEHFIAARVVSRQPSKQGVARLLGCRRVT